MLCITLNTFIFKEEIHLDLSLNFQVTSKFFLLLHRRILAMKLGMI